MGLDCKSSLTVKGWFCNNTFKFWKTVVINVLYKPVQLINLAIDFLCVFIAFVNVVFLNFCICIARTCLNFLIDQLVDIVHMFYEIFVLQ